MIAALTLAISLLVAPSVSSATATTAAVSADGTGGICTTNPPSCG